MNKLIERIKHILKTKEIRSKILFSLLILLIFRLLSSVPVAGIPAEAIKSLFEGTSMGDVLSAVSGGVLETASIVAIGLTPYINASIVFQLLGTVIPALDETRKEGPEGRRKISMYTRLLTVPLAILQSFVIYSTLLGFGLITKLGPLELATMVATFTAGSVVMMWFGELISESGLGGGTSYLIMLGILAGIPGSIRSNFLTMDNLQKTLFIVISLIMVTSVVIITTAERRVKVQYSRRVRTGGALESYIPIKLTQSGVMPVIFAMAFLSFPQLVGKFLVSKNYNEGLTNVAEKVLDFINNPYIKDGLTFLLVIGFSFVYLSVVFKTDELAENLQKQGAFIQGIRPGENTSDYLRKISLRLAAVGAIFLALLSILPDLFVRVGLVNGAVFSGTGLLIVIGVILEVKRQVESMVTTRSYDRYL
ncbi:preprotein translocase subunit SecY [Candidatus Dojkabacteria bacterium]|jgi:preprotein translocase subunit SecY|uniref:Protein translocase subunit SecY n=1 Tax=Candidatus Dojkabacteria bacterium TaxID=2099670 RepID=A0A847CZF2_9BACT|nr:preprotein translocase subunit SecY [Candidatus Dojkabacteria bacterium]NLD25338.1 preprotein translocase subunit SecY [Candidatus Dojkabacteria bacterium]HRY74322.1 preprotein translocase subunit SecY [Candidatus Dojkabacteria bacterium]HRZ84652.1 preprotein translocase subunit SecY [Candidatus Dojkabacteria bacterium]